MKILFLPNWKIQYCRETPADKQPPDYCVEGEPYWFFKHYKDQPEVDVVDVSSFPWLENFEKNKLRFYIWQTLKVLPRLNQYDLILSHGMQSGVVLSLIRRFIKTKAKHIVFDIGSFNSAAESGIALKLMQFSSRSIDGVIYHTSSQRDYYAKFYPWLVKKSRFIRFGTDMEFFDPTDFQESEDKGGYMICVGSSKRDWNTLVQAYLKLNADIALRMVGRVEKRLANIPGVEQLPHVPVREMARQIHNAAFAVLPLESFNYSYGQMTLMQQMALGKCVIAARVPSLVDYIEDGKTALMYEPCDAEDLAEKLRFVIENPAAREQIASNGQAYLREYCNEQIMAQEIENFIHTIV